jgi:membrane peptidoglycan carboxypeptidase
MSVAPEILRKRHRRRDSSRQNTAGLLALGCSLILSLVFALSGVTFAIAYTNMTTDLPSLETLPALLNPPDGLLLQPTTMYDNSGEHELLKLENPAAVDRQYLNLDQTQANFIPTVLISATIATSDPQFWQHSGFTIDDLDPNSHPTLAQRLVADLLLWNESPSLRRALRERILAAQITKEYGREQVLTWYLNSANYGRLNYGADSAARTYFGLTASELDLPQAAVLAAVAEAPALNPSDAPQVAIERSQEVIHSMLAQGLIDEKQATKAFTEKPDFQTQLVQNNNLAPAYVSLALRQLEDQFNLERLKRGGLKILTTLDYDLQYQINCTSAIHLARLYQSNELTTEVNKDDCQAARLLPTLRTRNGNRQQALASNTVIIDPQTGQVLAMVGEITPGLDPSQSPGHTPGTLWTPFIYLTGFTRGLSPASLLWDIPSVSQSKENLNGEFHGPVRLRTALANDYLAPAVQVLNQVGAENVWRTARLFSLDSATMPVDGSVKAILEEGEATLLDISRAFGVFANQGTLAGEVATSPDIEDDEKLIQPVTVLKMEDFKGNVWFNGNPPIQLPVINPQLAYLVNNILADEPARWPTLGHPNPLEIGQPVAAKVGRVASEREIWTIGYTPDLVVGVWIGPADEDLNEQVFPADAAALWNSIIKYASQDESSRGWEVPLGINQVSVCDPSGMLPTEDCPVIVDEIFLAGNEPTQADTLYRRMQVNRETGLLATVFTPPELIEDRVYLIVPSEAAEWARQAGLPTPPESYDVLSYEQTISPDVNINFPSIFSYVSGNVSVEGTATGEGFESYRLQVGQGLNPSQWLHLGQDITEPVVDSQLGQWDTGDTNGLHALQLLVVYQDQRVEVATIQVTVDNQAPEIEIIHPTRGQVIQSTDGNITVRVDASDNLELEDVDFYLDGELVKGVSQAPFVLPIRVKTGTHILRVEAHDRAGNGNEDTLRFVVER